MNLYQTVVNTLEESGLYVDTLSWEQDYGIVKEITDWMPDDMEPLKPGERLYKVSDNWRKRAGYMKVDEYRNELGFHHIIIY